MASPIYQHQELQVHGLDRGAGDACAHACREGGLRILHVVDMMVMMDMMVDVTRGCLYSVHNTCMLRRWASNIGRGGHDGHGGHDGGHY